MVGSPADHVCRRTEVDARTSARLVSPPLMLIARAGKARFSANTRSYCSGGTVRFPWGIGAGSLSGVHDDAGNARVGQRTHEAMEMFIGIEIEGRSVAAGRASDAQAALTVTDSLWAPAMAATQRATVSGSAMRQAPKARPAGRWGGYVEVDFVGVIHPVRVASAKS